MIKKLFILFLLILLVSLKGALAQCAGIDFKANDTIGCAPLIVKFDALNFPPGSDFAWDFGSGYSSQSSADSTKSNIFNITGSYTIRLKVFLSGGVNVCVITKNNYISVVNKPTAQFTIDKTLLCNGNDTVTFTDITPKSQSRDWLIDGVIYPNAPRVIKHYFNLDGYKSVNLNITDSNGCSAFANSDSAVNVLVKPTMDFTASITTGCTPATVNFVPTITGLTSQTISSYTWTLPGSSTPTTSTSSPTVTYASEGSFDVTLTITTNFGCTYTITKTAYINVGNPIIITFQANSTSLCIKQPARIVNTTPGKPFPGKFTWVLPPDAIITKGDTLSDTIYIQFNKTGQYDVGLKYIYNSCPSSIMKTNYITVITPTADFNSLDRLNCTFPDTVNITNLSIMPSSGTNTFSWTLYDNDKITVLDTSTATNPSFILYKFGRFDVRLIAYNSNGCSDTLRITNFAIIDTALGNFSAFPSIACPGQPIQFTDNTPLFSTKAIKRLKWTFYSLDSIHTLDFSFGGNDTIINPIVKYDTIGKYNVKMVVYNNIGCTDTIFKDRFITIGLDTADFSSSDSNICAGEGITFVQQNRVNISSLLHEWTIQNKDSANITITGTGSPFLAVFPVPGIYNVKYRSRNGIYCSDSITKNNYVKVSGVKGTLSSNKNTGCSPTTINFSSTIIYNFHYINPSALIQFQWSCAPAGNGASITGSSIATPTNPGTFITFTENGTYLVYCKFTNSEGCVYIDSANAIIINIGTHALFDAFGVFCLYDTTASVINKSTLNPVSYKWSSDGAVSFLPYDTSTNPKLRFNQRGFHPITLTAKSIDGCLDSLTKFIILTQPTANFVTNDTYSICGPVLVTFHSHSSSDVTLFTWDFGDGSPPLKSTDSVISHLFSIKNGRSSFDIKLTVENNYGCFDVMVKQNYIQIVGPVPFIKISNNKGCEPLTVHIIDSSRNIFKFYFNYGFGPIDSTTIGDKVYMLASPNALYSVYKPVLFVTDSTGTCFQIYQPADSIVVYRNPKAYFYVNDSDNCSPFTVSFIDTSLAAVRWKWDFDNDGIIDDTTQNPVYTYTNAGIYSVKLIVTNQFGCTDSLVKTNYITALARPVAKFSISDTIVCPHTAVSFVNQSTSVSPLQRYHWDFGIPGIFTDTSDNADPAPIIYDVMGVYTVKLYIQDVNGCDDSLVKTNVIRVLDSLPPSQPQIYYVTVVNDKDIKIVWNENTANDFASYNLFRSQGGPFTPLVSKNVITDTTYTDNSGINVKTQPYFYTMDAADNCNYTTPNGTIHNSIYLDATTFSQNSNLISWTGYYAWNPGTYNFKLYRSHSYGGPYSLYAQLKDIDTVFIDANLCDSDYFYYVEAVQTLTNFASRSNIDFNHPPFYVPNIPLELIRATVINDKDILIEWDTSGIINTNKKQYLLEKMDANGVFKNITTTTNNSYIDNQVDVHSKSYTYRILMEDYCGNTTPGSNIGKSINLKVNNIDYTVILTWNAYEDWANNVQAYILEIYDNSTSKFKLVAILPNTDTTYTDTKFYASDSAFCYRVTAIEDLQAIPDTSVSNVACILLPSKLTVPNAFSPNNDGINDIFYPQGVFIQNLTGKPLIDYSLRIFDRWGNQLFETNDLNKGWDGNFNDRACEIGVYIYQLRATGSDKQRYNYKGTLQLIR